MSDTTAVNQAYFNNLASEYDTRFQNTIERLEEEVRARADLLGARPGGRLLDYACGTGLLSRVRIPSNGPQKGIRLQRRKGRKLTCNQALGPQLSRCVGIDISESMVEQYNARSNRDGLAPEKCIACVGNLLSPDDPSPEKFSSPDFFDFDLAGVGLGFHHMDDCALAAKQLAHRLRPGGVLFIVDFVTHAPPPSEQISSVRHNGFTEQQVRDMFEGAGAGGNFAFHALPEDITFENAHGKGKHMARRVFIARGEKEQ
ncbi:hypothetical protein E4U47_003617 [Claviceps purpurea]|nr:hypothetical protein E4U49_000537 [Claviceps purpurea]KAG6270352.1 hypothetical protein E4U47_003617 [Claviceps purpurea]KAG6315148.1 hypothetical protein E4U44_001500 [Claviceps purpurea]